MILLPVAPSLPEVVGTALRVLVSVLVVLIIAVGALPRRSADRGLEIALAVGFGIVIAATAIRGLDAYAMSRAANWLMFAPLLLVRWTERATRSMITGLLASVWVLAAGIVVQAFGLLTGTWGGLPRMEAGATTWATRYTSFTQNPNDLGLIAAISAMFALAGAVTTTHRRTRLVAGSSAFVAVLMCLATGSRGGFVAMVLGLTFVLAFAGRRVIPPWPMMLASVATIALVLALTPAGTTVYRTVASVADIANGDDQSASNRTSLWADRFAAFDRPILGEGFGGYVGRSGASDEAGLPSSRRHVDTTVDNGWLKLWLEAGSVGLTLFCAIVLVGIRSGFRSRSIWARCAAAGLCLLALRAGSADILDINPWNYYWWLLLGLASYDAVAVSTVGAKANESPSDLTSKTLT